MAETLTNNKQQQELEQCKKENRKLKSENKELSKKLDIYIERWVKS